MVRLEIERATVENLRRPRSVALTAASFFAAIAPFQPQVAEGEVDVGVIGHIGEGGLQVSLCAVEVPG